MRKKTLLCLTLLALGGCADVANMAGYDSRTINLKAAEGYQQILGEAQSQNALDTRSPTAQRVHNIFNRMVPAANANNRTGVPFNWEMHVIRSDELNAWAMPGGKMAVYSGLVEKLNLTDDELAAVIGHESLAAACSPKTAASTRKPCKPAARSSPNTASANPSAASTKPKRTSAG